MIIKKRSKLMNCLGGHLKIQNNEKANLYLKKNLTNRREAKLRYRND